MGGLLDLRSENTLHGRDRQLSLDTSLNSSFSATANPSDLGVSDQPGAKRFSELWPVYRLLGPVKGPFSGRLTCHEYLAPMMGREASDLFHATPWQSSLGKERKHLE